jgi:hypothetical protein
MIRTLLAVLFLPSALCVPAAACQPTGMPTPHEVEPRTVTILDTYYVRFQVDGESYHAVPIDGDEFLRSSSGRHFFQGPVYVRREGGVWQCHSRGYQVPQGARIMISSSRAPVTLHAEKGYCR